jgi:hypothetical protein
LLLMVVSNKSSENAVGRVRVCCPHRLHWRFPCVRQPVCFRALLPDCRAVVDLASSSMFQSGSVCRRQWTLILPVLAVTWTLVLFGAELLDTWWTVSELYWHVPTLAVLGTPVTVLCAWCVLTTGGTERARTRILKPFKVCYDSRV